MPRWHLFSARCKFADFDFNPHVDELFDGSGVILINSHSLRNQCIAVFVRHAAEVDGLERNAAFDRTDDISWVREEEERLERSVFWVLIGCYGFFDRNDISLDARRSNLQQEFFAQRVLCDIIVAAHDAVAARDLCPDGSDLTVNQAVVNTAECDFHDSTSLSYTSIPRLWGCFFNG